MNLDDILATLREPATFREALATHWDAAQAALPPGLPDFLQPDAIRAAWQYGSFDQPLPPELLAMADRIAADPVLLRMAWYMRWRIIDGPREPIQWTWPSLRDSLGDDAGMVHLLAALAFIPAVRAYHASLRLPEAITRDTCRQPGCFLLNYRRGNQNRFGIYTNQLGWLGNYLAPNLYFRIGRFEYWWRQQRQTAHVYRHNASGEVIALAPGDTTFTAEGTRCFAKDQPNPPGSWQSVLTETDTTITGHPITPTGRGLPRPVTLARAEWTRVLQPGDMILDMHIPSGGAMPIEACLQSFRDAVAFFRTHFPDRAPAKAICSTSWMFSDQLEQALPPDANLVRLVRELYLLPVACQPNDSLWFVFLQNPFDPTTSPRETSLQRAILDYLAKGNAWHPCGMFVLPDDLPRLGSQHYRRHWPAQAGSAS